MYYSYIEIEYVATSFSPARTDLAVKLLNTLEATHVRMPKMMLPATQTSCLKDSHTNLQRFIGIGTRYFVDFLSLYVKK
jgi:hypothetical protein